MANSQACERLAAAPRHKGFFLSFEGIDGSGKSTQIERLRGFLNERGIEAIFLREPGGTRIGEEVRRLLKDPAFPEMTGLGELLLFSAGRAQLCRERIRPALADGKWVVCDRFFDSTFAYQGYGRGLPLETIRAVTEAATEGLAPDLTLWFDIAPEAARRRVAARGAAEADRLDAEAAAFSARVDAGYRSLYESEAQRIVRIPAEGGEDGIFASIEAAIRERRPDL